MYSVTQNYSDYANWPIGKLETELDAAWVSTSSGSQPTPAFFPSLRDVGHVVPCTSASGHGEMGQPLSACNTNTGLVTSVNRPPVPTRTSLGSTTESWEITNLVYYVVFVG